MAVIGLNPADPEIAAALFKAHLDNLWEAAWVGRRGWQRRDLDPLHSVITMSAARASGGSDTYFIRLGAEYYDLGPPVVNFVCEDGCTIAPHPSKYYPLFGIRPAWFALHPAYQYLAPRPPGQLVCYSMSADFYLSDHSPTDTQLWKKGTHTVAATLTRLAEVLQPPYYQRPSST